MTVDLEAPAVPAVERMAIRCRDVCRSYGKLKVISNMDLTVPQGQIYGLLGPSGCGKTTLLKCIVGTLKISQGHISVLGKPPAFPGHEVPGRMVGYMPQDLALYNEFTISDTLTFFGHIHGLTSKETQARMDFLVEFLDLPQKCSLVRNLSGGQRRRVSLGAALLQNPQLLILDEPTVGVDPVLRAKIWQHLVEIVKTGKVSVIITTHYIEEARQANVRRNKRRRRGRRAGILVRLRRQVTRPPLPSMLLANVQSLDNKLSELWARISFHRESRDCNVICLTETWLSPSVPDHAVAPHGFSVFRADRSADLSGKKIGGGVCFLTNNAWCNPDSIHPLKQFCSPDVEYLMLLCRPFWLPREFTAIILTAVYIPPQANTECALRELYCRNTALYINFKTRGSKTLDHCYSPFRNAYKPLLRPPFGKSDHASILLLPAYKQRLKQTAPTMRSIHRWSDQSDAELQDCFELVDWEVFWEATADIHEYTDTVMSFIQKCVEDIVPTKTVCVFPNQKAWLDHSVRLALTARDRAFSSGNMEEGKIAQYNLRKAIKLAKKQYREKIERQLKGPPEEVIKQHNAPTLEHAFLQLCETSDLIDSKRCPSQQGGVLDSSQSFESGREESQPILSLGPGGSPEDLPKYAADWKVRARHVLPKWRNISALMIKTLIRMKRMPGSLCFQFLLPVIQISLMCLCIGGDPKGIQVAVVNNETSTSAYSQLLLAFLDNSSIEQVPLSHADAFTGIYNGEYWGVIGFGKNFTSYLTMRMFNPHVSKDVVDGGSVYVWLDLTNQQIALMLQKKVHQAFQAFVDNKLRSMAYLVALPIKIEEPIYGSLNTDFTTFITPGAVLSITFYLAVGLTALSFVLERKEGLLDRCWVAGVSSLDTMLAHLLCQLFVISVQIILMLLFVLLVFKIPNEGSLVLVVALIVMQGVTGIAFGLVISAAIDDEQNANQAALGVFYPNLVISGVIWPVECIPYPLRYLSLALPQTYASEALRCIMYRGWGLGRMMVWRGFAVSLGWNTFFFLLATIILKLRT
ncbi:ABC transporter G family member 23 [Merluccius polli]|uniref:ABC transporter G family member 23 n=1 Tax=Merluccius polli TaxID=89951 RepID=A0AA47N180_MERPO|nr:ABC transporter G family member 23 [Merluccius polli]